MPSPGPTANLPSDPTTPASQGQNEAILRAAARAAAAFAESGYDVYVDGVVGPWFLPVVLAEAPAGTQTSYVVLRVPEDEALRRVRGRRDGSESHRVAPMVRAFDPQACGMLAWERL